SDLGDDAAERLYFDAIGYSWDSNYDIGDNIYEGLVLNFTIGTELDWIGYSLDGQNNLTIPGNTTIPMPDEGSHAIQVYANNSIGTKFATAIIYFTVFVDYYLDIINHTENGVSVPPGLIEVNANADFNVTLTCGTRAGSSYYTWTNASFSYRINEGSWTGPSFIGSHYGIKNSTFVIEEGNYSINDNLYYYVYFIQLDNSSNILEEFYWTQDGIKYDENEARLAAFHKRVNTVLYNLTLDYSVFYRAQLERVMPNEVGFNESVYPWKNIAYENISLSFYNTTSAKTNFSVSCINESKLAHYVDEITRNISKAVDPQFDVNQGIMSPFTLSLSNNYTADFSNITIPQISFDSINDSRNLTFTGNLLNVTYKGVENFPYSYRTVLRFSTVDENIIIRFDMFTGIMVYFYYCNATANASQAITFALIDNNQNYPINLLVEMRYETEEDGFIIIPRYLWNIIHDPPGDQSYCSLAAGTTITKGFSIEIGVSSGIYFEFQALGCGVGGGMSFEMKHKTSTEFDFEFEITYGTFLTSSTNSENSSLIGPGRGDLYYGSGLVLQYFIKVNNYYIVIGDQDPVDSQLDDKKIWQNGSRVEYGLSADTEFTVLGAQLDYYGMSDLAAYNMFADNNITEEEEPYVELAAGPLFWTPNTISEYSYAHSSTFGMTLTNTIEFSLDAFFCWDIEVEEFWTGATVFQSEGKIGVTVEFSMETVSTSSTEFNREIVCHLEDDDGAPIGEHDQFMSYIYHDLQYSTYGVIYVENFTYTSRPFEIGTKDRRSPTTSEIYDLAEYVQGVITLNCGAIDDETGVNHVKFYYDNDPIFDEDSTQIGYQDNSTIGDPNLYQFSWNTSLLHGTYYLFAVTFDNADPQWNSKISDTYSINIDNILPTTCQARAYEPYRDAINLYVNAFDADSGIEYVEYWDGDPDNPGSTLLGISYEPSSSFNFVWATAPNGADDGTHYIYARAYDKAGNYLDSSAIDIKVDNLSVPISTTEILLWSILILGIVGISAYILNNTIFKRRTRPEAPPPKKIPPPKSKFTKSSGKITESSDQ
ncbi:MAG: hypothetical protein HWN66_12210, partial [Candidatus Helarchaeota archaeon]|nr:hypothetical protein [Candidatus Helarchaeota archaeon]